MEIEKVRAMLSQRDYKKDKEMKRMAKRASDSPAKKEEEGEIV